MDNRALDESRLRICRLGATVAYDEHLDSPFQMHPLIAEMFGDLPGEVNYEEGWNGATLMQIQEIGRFEMIRIIENAGLDIPIDQLVAQIVAGVSSRVRHRIGTHRHRNNKDGARSAGREHRRDQQKTEALGLPVTDRIVARVTGKSVRRIRHNRQARAVQFPCHCDLRCAFYDPHSRVARFSRTSIHEDTTDRQDLKKRHDLAIPEVDDDGNDE